MMLVLLLLMPALTVVAEGGVNEQTSLEGTPISSVDSHSEASAGEPFDISVTITQEASENITSVDWDNPDMHQLWSLLPARGASIDLR